MPRLRLLIGPAGSGKTYTVIDEAARLALERPLAGPPLLIIVPEQQAVMTERSVLARMCELSGQTSAASARLRVMSLSRLAVWLAERSGHTRRALSDLSRRLLIWTLLKDEGEREARAEVFSELLSELAKYCVTPEQLRLRAELLLSEAAGKTEAQRHHAGKLAAKLSELASVQQRYMQVCEERGLAFASPVAQIPALLSAENLPQLGETRVWLDGFAGFTPEEGRAIEAVLARCSELCATVLIDPLRLGGALPRDLTDWYQPVRELHAELREIAQQCGAQIEQRELTVLQRWDYSSPLKLLAINGVQPALQAAAEVRRAQDMEAAAAAQAALPAATALVCRNAREEAHQAAAHVAALVRAQGLRYGAISVVLRSLEGHSDLLAGALDEHGIPNFIDRRRPLAYHPAVELLRCGLRLALSTATPDDLMTYLKCDLTPLPPELAGEPCEDRTALWRDMVAQLENYALAHGLYVSHWLDSEDWTYHKGRLLRGDEADPASADPRWAELMQRYDQWRRCAMRPVLELQRELKELPDESRTVKAVIATAWRALFERGDASADDSAAVQLAAWARDCEDTAPELAEAHRRVLEVLAALLEDFASIAGDAVLSAEELCRWLEFGLAELNLGYAPQRLDRVLVTDIERGRHHSVDATLLLGLAEDSWPPAAGEAPYLSDEERSLINHGEPLIAGGAAEQSQREPYLLLVAATRPGKFLYVSRPAADSDGRERPASPYFSDICDALDIDEQAPPELPLQSVLRVVSSTDQLSRFAALLPAGNALEQLAAARFAQVPAVGAIQWARNSAASGGNLAPLPQDRLAELLGSTGDELVLSCSASRLEAFAACPFKHYMHYFLHLRERDEAQFDALALGSFYHHVLDRAVRRLNAAGYDWTSGADGPIRLAAFEALDELAPELARETARQHIPHVLRRARLLLEHHARELAKQGVAGRRPVQTELRFGGSDSTVGPVVVGTKRGEVRIGGFIDRLDVDSGRASVVDYKLTHRSVRWPLFLAGAQVQLFVYLLALRGMQHEGLTPASAEYQGIEPRWNESEASFKPARVPAAKEADPTALLDAVLEQTLRITGELGAAILSGEIAPCPLRLADGKWALAINDANYRAVSRFDPLHLGRHRRVPAGRGADLLKAIRDGEDFSGSASTSASARAGGL